MKKITLLILTILISVSGFAQFPAPYCGPITYGFSVEPITLVNFAGINNTTSATVGSNPEHEDFTAIIGNVIAGDTYPISLKGNTDGAYSTYLRVFVDWNQNNVFTDAGESYDIGIITNSTGDAASTALTGSILVPGSALAGNTRMRVVKNYAAYTDSCNLNGGSFGQAEDYTLTVTAASCISPSAGMVTANTSTTASLTWTSNGPTNAEIVVQTAGTGTPAMANNTGVNVTANSYSATGLTTGTNYEFYVRNECTDGVLFSSWAGPYLFNTFTLNNCPGNPLPVDMATDVPVGAVTLTWDIPTIGEAPTSYDLYAGDSPTTLALLGNYTTNSTGTDLVINAYNAVIYWQVIPINPAGQPTGCVVWSFTTQSSPGYCLAAPNGLYPATSYVPATCDGLTENVINTFCYAGEYSNVTVTSGQTYTFKSSIGTDFITISTDDGATAAVYGVTPLTWISTVSGDVRFYTHVDDQCGSEAAPRSRIVICGVASTDSPDYVSLQFPASATITQGGSATVYGQVYEGGLTDVMPNIIGQAPGINAFVGISPIGANTNPNTWTNWIPATWNSGNVSNNDEYQATIGATLAPGTYYYATRFNLNNGAYVYGGIDSANNGNFWDGTTYLSGVLTVSPPPAPVNDLCSAATVLTPGGVFTDNAVNGTLLGATTTAGVTPSCQTNSNLEVWYSIVVPASGNITIEAQVAAANSLTDSVLAAFSGTCGALTQIGCDDDGGPAGPNSLMSLLTLTGLNAGDTIYIGLWKFGAGPATGTNSLFKISAYDASLATTAFNSSTFSYYPNPVKDVLNLQYSGEISKVQVINLLGQEVIAKSINASQTQIDMASLPRGTYLVKVTADGVEKTIKVLKE